MTKVKPRDTIKKNNKPPIKEREEKQMFYVVYRKGNFIFHDRMNKEELNSLRKDESFTIVSIS